MNIKVKKDTSPKRHSQLLSTGIISDNSEMNNILIMMEKLLQWAAIIESPNDDIINKSADGFIKMGHSIRNIRI